MQAIWSSTPDCNFGEDIVMLPQDSDWNPEISETSANEKQMPFIIKEGAEALNEAAAAALLRGDISTGKIHIRLQPFGEGIYMQRDFAPLRGTNYIEYVFFSNISRFKAWLESDPLRFDTRVYLDILRWSHTLCMPETTDPAAPIPSALIQSVYQPHYTEIATATIERLVNSHTPAQAQIKFNECIKSLGAEHGFFCNFSRYRGAISDLRLMLACSPAVFHKCVTGGQHSEDWISSVIQKIEPTPIYRLRVNEPEPLNNEPHAIQEEFSSLYLVPVHPPISGARTSLLGLGSSKCGFFEEEGLLRFKFAARTLAQEMHEWWCQKLRDEFMRDTRISTAELDLIVHDQCGRSSKQIARLLKCSEGAINSRFQRLNAKLGTRSRRETARLVISYGLGSLNGL